MNYMPDYHYQQLLEEEFILNLVAKKYAPEAVFSERVLSTWAFANGFKKIDDSEGVKYSW